MALILSIETSTNVCSIAFHVDGTLLCLEEIHQGKSHSKLLVELIHDLAKQNDLNLASIDAIAVSCGPGSYTGLRIGISTAKGLCYGLSKPLISIDSLEILVSGIEKFNLNNYLLCPMIDARRMEVYCAVFLPDLTKIQDISAEIITMDSFSHVLNSSKMICFGDGALKCKEIFSKHEDIIIISGVYPSAKYMGKVADKKFKLQEFENVSVFEPFYLKEFVSNVKK